VKSVQVVVRAAPRVCNPRKMQGSGSTAIVQPRSRGGFGNTEALSEREAQATRETLVMRARPPDDILAPNGS
jgi:hypothetical protein